MKKLSGVVRRILLDIAGNESLFLFAAFISAGVLSMGPLAWYREATDAFANYVVVPWGMALCLLRLERRARSGDAPVRTDVVALFVLLMWVIVPFALRFGLTFNNVTSWHGSVVVYFGIYAMVTEETPERRERLFDLACALFGALSLVMGGALLYCAATAQAFGVGLGDYGFGLCDGIYLCNGLHYNITGMIAVCCAMMSLAGCGRSRHVIGRLAYALAACVMMAVIVLTQSRTARYALILALAAGCYRVAVSRARIDGAAKRQIVGIVAAVLMAIVGYVGASLLTDAALARYEQVNGARLAAQAVQPAADPSAETQAAAKDGVTAPDGGASASPAAKEDEQTAADEPAVSNEDVQALADEPAMPDEGVQPPADEPTATGEPAQLEAREAVDATLSGRTDVWMNLIRLWREEPKHFLIGNGVGRTGSRVVEGTIHEANGAVAIHNTYLQFVADFGLVGMLLLCVFVATILRPVLRVFFGGRSGSGYLALCMLVLASLLTGMMESAPLGAMTPMNMMLFFALALLTAHGREQE
ncbi:MAG: O-antigen ligase family protein [Clostridia bacterium]|nr:O-antigen ligase family protein [Clostridia bacterium]